MSPKNEAPVNPPREEPVTVIRIVCERHKRPKLVTKLEVEEFLGPKDRRIRLAAGVAGGETVSQIRRDADILRHAEAFKAQASSLMSEHGDDQLAADVFPEVIDFLQCYERATLFEVWDQLQGWVTIYRGRFDSRGVDPYRVKDPKPAEAPTTVHSPGGWKLATAVSPTRGPVVNLTCPSCASSKKRYQRFTAGHPELSAVGVALYEQGVTEIEVHELKRIYDAFSSRSRNETGGTG